LHLGPPIELPHVNESGNQYRLYFFEVAHITKSHEFYAADDAAAIKLAEGWREGRETELWCRDRRVRAWR
jgi:hypothetical protein